MRSPVRALFALLCLSALWTGAAAPAWANVFALDGQDPRAPTPRTGADRLYAPVGSVTTDATVPASDDGARRIRTRGTGFLVSPCYVLTNYHAVFGLAFDGPDRDRDYSVTFAVGPDPDYQFRWRIQGKPVRWGAFNRRKEHDWALVKLEGCVGGQADVGWMELAGESGADLSGAKVSLAGYPADKTGVAIWVQPSCRIEGPQPGTAKVLHDCAVHAGASGGPLIGRTEGGQVAVAIQCGELNAVSDPLGRYDSRHANTAVTVAEVMQDAEARRLIEEDRALFPGPNPAQAPPQPPAEPRLVADAGDLR